MKYYSQYRIHDLFELQESLSGCKRVRDASIYASKKISLKYLFLSDIFLFAENGGYPPTQNGDIRSLFWLFSLMALQN